MRILHTSDWHLGRKLYDYSLLHEQEQFLAWLLELIKSENIDLLIVAGDVFDSALPSGDATQAYYKFLYDLHKQSNIPAIIIAGNHDSSARLMAPRNFLAVAGIHIFGYSSHDPLDYLIPVDNGKDAVYVTAIPYISEGDILSHVSFEDTVQRSQRYRIAVSDYYSNCYQQITDDIPCIGVGHFFLQGGTISQSERVINIGGTQPLCKEDLPCGIQYFALGHLHRPQEISNGNMASIIYSGSPLPMTFKEAKHDKYVYIHDTNKPSNNQAIPVPVFRELQTVNGTLNQILRVLADNDWHGKLIEANLIIDEPIPGA